MLNKTAQNVRLNFTVQQWIAKHIQQKKELPPLKTDW